MNNIELLKNAVKLIEELEPSYFGDDDTMNLYYSTLKHLRNEISIQNDVTMILDSEGSFHKWQDKEYRDAYMEASIEQGIAWQIRTNRHLRGITQTDLAEAIDMTQSDISKLEDSNCGAPSLETIVEIAKSFDCALSVKLIPFSHLAYESKKLGEVDLYVASFTEEMKEIHDEQAKKESLKCCQ